jgi:hypothetical protein
MKRNDGNPGPFALEQKSPESGGQDTPVYKGLRNQAPGKPILTYHGEGGPTCPDCDVPDGEEHRAGCALLRPLGVRWEADCTQGNSPITDAVPEVEQAPVLPLESDSGDPFGHGRKDA